MFKHINVSSNVINKVGKKLAFGRTESNMKTFIFNGNLDPEQEGQDDPK